MPHSKRKIRNQRGSRTHGWGQVGQHRAGGSRGGKGKTGRGKHKWTYVVKYEPDYFGKHGFHPVTKSSIRTINVGELNEITDQLLSKELAKQKEKKIIVDLNSLGYDKLLGTGQITKPLIIKVKEHSKKAVEKVEGAGGKILGLKKT